MLESTNQQQFRKKLENLCMIYDAKILLSTNISRVIYTNDWIPGGIEHCQDDEIGEYSQFDLPITPKGFGPKQLWVHRTVDEEKSTNFNEILSYVFVYAYWNHLLSAHGVTRENIVNPTLKLCSWIALGTLEEENINDKVYAKLERMPDRNLPWRKYFAELESLIEKPLTELIQREYNNNHD